MTHQYKLQKFKMSRKIFTLKCQVLICRDKHWLSIPNINWETISISSCVDFYTFKPTCSFSFRFQSLQHSPQLDSTVETSMLNLLLPFSFFQSLQHSPQLLRLLCLTFYFLFFCFQSLQHSSHVLMITWHWPGKTFCSLVRYKCCKQLNF